MGACATFDLSGDCPLRCAHCYYFAGETAPARRLSDAAYLRRLERLRDGHRLTTALWLGGEPLLEPELLLRASRLFSRNAVATSGVVPIPDELDAAVLVSVDGLEPEHDRLRGRGAFRRVLRALRQRRPPRGFALQLTLTALTLSAIDGLRRLRDATGSSGVLVGLFTGSDASPYALGPAQRSRAVDALLELKAREPDVLLNSLCGLELLRERGALSRGCPYRRGDVAFDVQLRRKAPCSFGAAADCASCGCALLALRAAADDGDAASHEALCTLFPVSARA